MNIDTPSAILPKQLTNDDANGVPQTTGLLR
jgi:hypothetical protein